MASCADSAISARLVSPWSGGEPAFSAGSLFSGGLAGKSGQITAYRKANNITISNIFSSLLMMISKTPQCVTICHVKVAGAVPVTVKKTSPPV
jgi:hypothetical protein